MIKLSLIAILCLGGCSSLIGRHEVEKDWACKCDCKDSRFECYKDGGTTINIKGQDNGK